MNLGCQGFICIRCLQVFSGLGHGTVRSRIQVGKALFVRNDYVSPPGFVSEPVPLGWQFIDPVVRVGKSLLHAYPQDESPTVVTAFFIGRRSHILSGFADRHWPFFEFLAGRERQTDRLEALRSSDFHGYSQPR